MNTGEIAGIVDEYRRATRHALQAGFDGVELHAASGYLPLRPLFDGTLLLGGGLDRDSAASLIAQRGADAAVFGSLYLANPDLLQRFVAGAPLNAPERDTFYSDGPQGYIDYPVLEQMP